MSAAIRNALRLVADARADADAATEALKLKRALFASENAALTEHEASMKKVADVFETQAKSVLLAHFTATGEKSPVTGGEIKMFATMGYLHEDALKWARDKNMALVPESLDAKAFEKIAKATPLAFVVYGEEPRASIASQLNAALLAEPVEVAP